MKTISLWQPWASLLVAGHKVFETRSFDTNYRGPLLIHAAKCWNKKQRDFYEWFLKHNEDRHPDWKDIPLPKGGIIGKVDVVNTTTTDYAHIYIPKKYSGRYLEILSMGDYSTDSPRFAWETENPVLFKHFIPEKGRQLFWNFKERLCLKCGCRDNNACTDPKFGNCYWVGENLCSQCFRKK